MNVHHIGLYLLSAILALLAGCSDPRIDATTDKTTEDSLALVRFSLSESRREEFEQALQLTANVEIGVDEIYSSNASAEVILNKKIRQNLHGKTAKQVIAEAARIKQKLNDIQKEKDLQEIRILEEIRRSASSQQQEINQFLILESSYQKRTHELLGFSNINQAVISLTVMNGTQEDITRADFEGTLSSQDQSEPWVRDVFSYTAAAAVAPGQKARWEIAAPYFLTNTETPPDAEFSVKVLRMYTGEDELPHSTSTFGEQEDTRLSELKKKYDLH